MRIHLIVIAVLGVAIFNVEPDKMLAANTPHNGGTWTVAPAMLSPANGHVAVRLQDGCILVLGGEPGMAESPDGWTQIFNPSTRTWSQMPSMYTGRAGETATLLRNGQVLVVGGLGPSLSALESVEIFDPQQSSWRPAASLPQPRFSHSASLMPDGRVLIVGGIVDSRISRSTIMYDPLLGRWEPGPPTHFPHAEQAAVTLHDGRILVAEGYGGRAEIYNPHTETWIATGRPAQRRQPVVAVLQNGHVLLASGLNSAYRDLRSAELYDPSNNSWTKAPPMQIQRDAAGGVLLPNGRVLVVGGEQSTGHILRSVELFDPASRSWSHAAPMQTPRAGPTLTLLLDGTVLVCGGANLEGAVASCELYHPARTGT